MCPLALFILMRKLPNAMFFSRCFGYNEFIALRVNFLHFRTVPHINICRQAPYVNLQLPNIQGIKNIENPGVNWLTQGASQWNALTLHFTRFLPDLFPMRGLAKIFQHNVGRETEETFVAVIPNPLKLCCKNLNVWECIPELKLLLPHRKSAKMYVWWIVNGLIDDAR